MGALVVRRRGVERCRTPKTAAAEHLGHAGLRDADALRDLCDRRLAPELVPELVGGCGNVQVAVVARALNDEFLGRGLDHPVPYAEQTATAEPGQAG